MKYIVLAFLVLGAIGTLMSACGPLVLDQPWRGFPVGEFTQDDLFYWVDAHHSKGVGWVYENISC